MDGSRFDALARTLGKSVTRRSAMKGLAAGLSGGLLARFGGDVAEARDFQVCHNGQPVTVSQQQLNLRLRQGDTLRVDCCADSDCTSSMGQCGQGVCQSGYCVTLPKPVGTPCDSGLSCTNGDACDGAGSCGAGAPITCAETENPCTTSVCSEAVQGCVEIPLDNGVSCGAGDACADQVCASGSCIRVPKTSCSGNCADCGGACVDRNTDLDNCGACGSVCPDMGACLTVTCQAPGICLNTPVHCPAGDQCNTAACHPDTGCYLQPQTGASCRTAGGHTGTCGEDGGCHPICAGITACSSSEDCGTNQVCWNGGCFSRCSGAGNCNTECATCYCSVPPSLNPNERVCADANFFIGPCAFDSDCPSGSYCNPNFVSGNGEKPNLCTRPCPEPAVA